MKTTPTSFFMVFGVDEDEYENGEYSLPCFVSKPKNQGNKYWDNEVKYDMIISEHSV